jgi:hypothetical protein
MGLVFTEEVAKNASAVVKQWVLSLRMLSAGDEREQAFW